MSWILFALGNHSEVQNKVHIELEESFGKQDYKPATLKELGQLKYLDRVIKETLRYYPAVPAMARSLDEDAVFG